MTALDLFNLMIQEGVPLSEEERIKVMKAFEIAVAENKVIMIEKDGRQIGFLTYKFKDNNLFVNYCLIYKRFRDRCNLLSIGKFLRNKFGCRFIWKSRRRNRFANVR